MSVWDLRQAIEQAIPWWVPFALPLGFAVALAARGMRKK